MVIYNYNNLGLQQILIDAFKLVGPTKKRKRQWKQRVENSEGLWCNERYNLTQVGYLMNLEIFFEMQAFLI